MNQLPIVGFRTNKAVISTGVFLLLFVTVFGCGGLLVGFFTLFCFATYVRYSVWMEMPQFGNTNGCKQKEPPEKIALPS